MLYEVTMTIQHRKTNTRHELGFVADAEGATEAEALILADWDLSGCGVERVVSRQLPPRSAPFLYSRLLKD